MDALKLWNEKKSFDKTYAAFQLHIQKEYNDLQQVGALSIRNSRMTPQMNLV